MTVAQLQLQSSPKLHGATGQVPCLRLLPTFSGIAPLHLQQPTLWHVVVHAGHYQCPASRNHFCAFQGPSFRLASSAAFYSCIAAAVRPCILPCADP